VWVKDKSDDEEFETKIKSFFDSIKKDLTKLERKGLNKPTKYSIEKTRRSLSAMVDYLKPVSEIIQHIDNEYGEQKQKKQEYENFLFKHYDIERTLSNYFAEMLNNPFVYLTGRAGTGKTHLLCSIVEERLNSNLPAIIFLGQEFQAIGSNPWENLIKNIDPGLTTTDFLDGLERLGEENSTRALICIDALNEGDIGGWKKAIDTLCEKVRPYKHIAIVLSFRSEYLSFIHDKLKDNKFREVFHVGFPPDKQLEAIKKYFSHYNIPLPNFPILDSEFSNPLFLRLFCETVEKVDIQKKHNHLKEIASGQSGMTKVLEDFIREKGKNINSKIGINSSTVWKSVKEGLAPDRLGFQSWP
jgi:hypothetical protein